METLCDYCEVQIDPIWDYCICCKRKIEHRPVRKSKKALNKALKPAPAPVKNKLPEIPLQPFLINIDNFFIRTTGVFEEIDSIPEGFTKFFSSKKSHYYTNDKQTVLIRASDHWGYKIKFCAWHLKGYKKILSWYWKKHYQNKERIGIIHFKDFDVNNEEYNYINGHQS